MLTRSLRSPTSYDRRRLVRLVRYLKGTRTFGMVMKRPAGKKGKVELELYGDTDFAQCKETESHDVRRDLLGQSGDVGVRATAGRAVHLERRS